MRLTGWVQTYDPNSDPTPTSGSFTSTYTIALPRYRARSNIGFFNYDIPTLRTSNGAVRDINSNITPAKPIVSHSGSWLFENGINIMEAMNIIRSNEGQGGTLIGWGIGNATSFYALNYTAILKSANITRSSEADSGKWLVSANFTFYLESSAWSTNVPTPGNFPNV